MSDRTPWASMQGPNGNAEIVEVVDEGADIFAPTYEVEFQGTTVATFKTLGEAHALADELTGLPNE